MPSKYSKLDLLGAGSFGKAYLARKNDSNRKYVIKEIKVSGMSEKEKNQVLTEVEILAKCRHLNVVRYREAFVAAACLNIVMEYADSGDLQKKIERQMNIHFDEQLILDWFVQICFGMKFIHGLHILHRDLKTQNIFLTSNNLIKIGDFGIARMLQNTDDRALTAIGTPYYLSPEICEHKPYNQKSDMWALGCVLYNLACLVPPFDAPDFTALVVKIVRAEYRPIPSHYSSLVSDLISSLLRVSASDRPSAEQTLCIRALQPHVDVYVERAMLHRQQAAACGSPADVLQSNPVRKTDREKKLTWATPRQAESDQGKSPKSSANAQRQIGIKMAIQDSPKLSLYKETLKKRQRSTSKSVSEVDKETHQVQSPVHKEFTPTKAVPNKQSLSMKLSYQSDENTPEGQPVKKLKPKTDISHTENVAPKNTPTRLIKAKNVLPSTPDNTSCTCSTPLSNDINKDTPKRSNVEDQYDGDVEEEMIKPLEAVNLSVHDDVQGERRGPKRKSDLMGGPTYKVCKVGQASSPCQRNFVSISSFSGTTQEEVCRYLYNTCATSKVDITNKIITLQAFLEGRLGAMKSTTCLNKVKQALGDDKNFDSVMQGFGDEIKYFPLMIQLVQLKMISETC